MSLLEIRDLTHFFGGLRAVYNLNLTLEGGELLGLIGPNGAGKTTVFNLVCGFYRPTEGEIQLLGKNIAGLRPHKVTALGIARTFQNIRLWNTLTVFDNLCISQHYLLGYGLVKSVLRTPSFRASEAKVRRTASELLELLGLNHYAKEYPKNLPYGLQRRLEIGRALSIHPKLLLLDEPAAGMNPGEVEQLIDLIRWIRTEFKLTIWLIEHHMRVVMSVCDHIKVLDFGETIADGTPDQVKQNRRVIQAYLGEEEPSYA
ncbi:ABC transporter ATP-binding protein [Syntrophobacter fumaroxidans]|uniref:ABC transporter related n=1 Tax=Syntrophobacter fumaroxidans (strain DSM 10017 / MPOB) TaxID=335543 RepID=A0LMX3_SYNFM|nr:ABC transporter ATP-binding protein [Syntrophobacter fumaroxidans]ABK18775.1 ABC transporter related [Syntrophobacter fumaroxidans MPOB]HOI94031.1 ABC transporter ATP-binding protein [Syntrophobacter fumaroxidans]